jgi:triacylglycerol esterase/lipase EstA (alpha/beta hydrolase family)
MKKFLLLAVLCSTLSFSNTAVHAAPDDTVMFIHGFLGWGRDEAFGIKYWGGLGQDYEADVRNAGVPAVTVAVGPVSSNWDRAIEAYYQMKGGCVDYGEAHARLHGHARYGRCYSALHSQWGASHKVNIISHSQGGQTARVLVQLLKEGSAQERTASGSQVADIFKGGKHWVRSVTTLSSPHLGTTLTKGVYTATFDLAEELISALAGLVGASTVAANVYDFKLDQWGLTRQPGETFHSYVRRMKTSPIFEPGHTKDISAWDLSPEGAVELNSWVKTHSDVYYFSLSTESTFRGLFTAKQYPVATTAVILTPSAYWLGSYRNTDPAPGEVLIDDAWLTNDAIVNTVSMKGPPGAMIVNFDPANPRKGVWNHLGLWQDWDHTDVIGHTWQLNILDLRSPRNWYLNHAQFLKGLN